MFRRAQSCNERPWTWRRDTGVERAQKTSTGKWGLTRTAFNKVPPCVLWIHGGPLYRQQTQTLQTTESSALSQSCAVIVYSVSPTGPHQGLGRGGYNDAYTAFNRLRATTTGWRDGHLAIGAHEAACATNLHPKTHGPRGCYTMLQVAQIPKSRFSIPSPKSSGAFWRSTLPNSSSAACLCSSVGGVYPSPILSEPGAGT